MLINYATVLVPRCLYLLLVHATGEIDEYLKHFRESLRYHGKYAEPGDQHPPDGMAYGSVNHWHWAITRHLYRRTGYKSAQTLIFKTREILEFSSPIDPQKNNPPELKK